MSSNFYAWVKDERILKNPSAKCSSPHPESCPYHGTKQLDKTDAENKDAGRGGDDVAKMDAAYADAVKRGDRETALKMIRQAAAKAFPNTKVVDKDGLPQVVYHNTDWDGKGAFNTDGAYFTTKRDPDGYYGKNELKVFLNICNPYEFDIETDLPYDIGTKWEGGDLTALSGEQIEQAGYDGVTTIEDNKYRHGEDWFFTTKPNQIKSADIEYDDDGNLIPLSKRFDDGDDIRGDVSKKEDSLLPADDAEMDRMYLDAVKSGNAEVCAAMVKERAKKMMPRTKIVEDDGSPKVAYHIGMLGGKGAWTASVDGSTAPDDSLGIHFGSYKAAMDRTSRPLRDDQVVVEQEDGGTWRWRTDSEHLDWLNKYSSGGFKSEDEAKLEALKQLRDLRLTKAYLNLENPTEGSDADAQVYKTSGWNAENDGMVYKNEYEDKGNDSYLVMKPSAIKLADPITYDDNGAVIPLSKRFDFKNPDIRY